MVFVRFRDFLVFVHPSSAKLNHEGVDGSILFRGARVHIMEWPHLCKES